MRKRRDNLVGEIILSIELTFAWRWNLIYQGMGKLISNWVSEKVTVESYIYMFVMSLWREYTIGSNEYFRMHLNCAQFYYHIANHIIILATPISYSFTLLFLITFGLYLVFMWKKCATAKIRITSLIWTWHVTTLSVSHPIFSNLVDRQREKWMTKCNYKVMKIWRERIFLLLEFFFLLRRINMKLMLNSVRHLADFTSISVSLSSIARKVRALMSKLAKTFYFMCHAKLII